MSCKYKSIAWGDLGSELGQMVQEHCSPDVDIHPTGFRGPVPQIPPAPMLGNTENCEMPSKQKCSVRMKVSCVLKAVGSLVICLKSCSDSELNRSFQASSLTSLIWFGTFLFHSVVIFFFFAAQLLLITAAHEFGYMA